MSSEAKPTSDHLPETPCPTVTELISELKTCFSSTDFQNVAKILMNREQDLLNKTHFLENEKDTILKENKNLNDLLKKKDAKIESLEKENDGLKDEVKKKQNEIGFYEEKVFDKWESAGIESGSCKKRMSSEKRESQERTNHRFSDIILIDDDDEEEEDENNLKDVSPLKRKRSSSNLKVEDDTDDERCISILKRKPATKELQSECNNDHDNIIPTGGQPLTSHSAISFLDSGKSDDEKFEEAYEPIKKNTKRWEIEAEMIIEFSKSYELCMNAVCALHRQNIVGAYLLPRFNQLAEWLIDGDPERKLKKTPSELNRFELDQCRMLAVNYSAELFKVYQQNADRFFPQRS